MEEPVRLLFLVESPEKERKILSLLKDLDCSLEVHRVGRLHDLLPALELPWDLAIIDIEEPGPEIGGAIDEIWLKEPTLPLIVFVDLETEIAVSLLLLDGAGDVVSRERMGRLPFVAQRLLRERKLRLEHLESERKILRLGLLYRMLSQAKQAIVRFNQASDLLQEICRLAFHIGFWERVRITQGQSSILVTAAEEGQGAPPPHLAERRVLESHSAVVLNDLEQELGSGFGQWQSVAVFPLFMGELVWGCLAFFSTSKGQFSDSEVPLLRDLADDLSFGLLSQAQKARQEHSEQALHDLASLVPGAFFKIRYSPREGFTIPYLSPGIDLLLPLTAQEAQSVPSLLIGAVHRGDRGRFLRTGRQSRRLLTVFSLEFRLCRPSGSVVWVLATAFPQRLENGATEWTGVALDVNSSHRLQEDLAYQQRLLSVVLDSVGDGVVAVDVFDKVVLLNREAARLLETEPGTTFRPAWEGLSAVLPWDGDPGFRSWYRTQESGKVLHLEVQAAQLHELNGESRGKVLVLRDNSERDQVEDRLRQSERLEAVGLLAGGIAHDFNNLLTGIFGFIQLAKMNAAADETTLGYLEQTQPPFERARALTHNLLTFARGTDLQAVPVSLETVMARSLSKVMTNQGVEVRNLALPNGLKVKAHEAQLQQVLEGVLMNARQALLDSPSDRKPFLEIRQRECWLSEGNLPGLEPGNYAELEIEDNGPGIPVELVSRVFDPFFTTKPGASGLGLSLCYSIVKRHGGSIEVHSERGAGTMFRVFWPCV